MWMFENDYQLAWTVYLAGALGCMLVGFRLTRWMWRWLREIIRLMGAVLLFTPTLVDPERLLFAPALAIGALDLLFNTGNNAWRAASDLALYGLIAFTLYLVLVIARWLVNRYVGRRPAEDARPLRERVVEDARDDDASLSGLRADARY